jgi:hypothetical protein
LSIINSTGKSCGNYQSWLAYGQSYQHRSMLSLF